MTRFHAAGGSPASSVLRYFRRKNKIREVAELNRRYKRAAVRARAVQSSVWGAVLAIYIALFATWAFLVGFGFGNGSTEHTGAAIVSPILLLVVASAVLGTLARAPGRTVALAAVDLAAAFVGLGNVLLVALWPSFWTGSFALLFAVSPALLLVAGALVVVDGLKQGARARSPQELRAGLPG